MIDIIIGGQSLDLPNTEVSFHFTNMFFSGKITDEYSIDFEIPRTRTNEIILNAPGLLFSPQKFNKAIKCNVITERMNITASLQVVEISERTIKIAVIKSMIPTEIAKLKIADVIHDDASTIFNFPTALTASGPVAQPTTDAGLFAFNMCGKTDTILLPSYYLPSIRLNSIFQRLTTATGYIFPTINTRYYLTATRRNYCPYDINHYMFLNGYNAQKFTDGGTPIGLGENKGISAAEPAVIVTYNHYAVASVEVEVFGRFINPLIRGGVAKICRIAPDGRATELFRLSTNVSTPYQKQKFNFPIRKGDKIAYINVKAELPAQYDGVSAFFVTYDVKNRNEAEYNTSELPRNLGTTPAIEGAPFVKHFFNRIGTISNLNDITIGELLTATCWQMGKQIEIHNENEIVFVEWLREHHIVADINRYRTASGCLAKSVTVEGADGRAVIEKKFDNQFLNDKKALYKSAFNYPLSKINNLADIRVYEKNADAAFELVEVDGVPLTFAKTEGGTTYLAAPSPTPAAVAMLNRFNKVLEVDCVTMNNINAVEYVFINGIRFAVVEGDADTKTNLTHFKALQCN